MAYFQKIPIWVILVGLAMEDLVYFMAIWSILRQFGIFCGHLIYCMVLFGIFFPHFGILAVSCVNLLLFVTPRR
jgi:hypothetical protein